ncbi:PLP-dependent aminotransferase family protein [Actinacidiphila epipremni]|uniref:Histidine decarboxylase n=1 Tax=Actinacidiphila epipremni TaxID=2053013 RepID=A0ABX1A045_9ACTN|nr:pyridoxal-dependent decarboxylase [Actinacidiphila epipremni]NJP47919.1 histidine decarboxylase [Actinacidiphila epipremni]
MAYQPPAAQALTRAAGTASTAAPGAPPQPAHHIGFAAADHDDTRGRLTALAAALRAADAAEAARTAPAPGADGCAGAASYDGDGTSYAELLAALADLDAPEDLSDPDDLGDTLDLNGGVGLDDPAGSGTGAGTAGSLLLGLERAVVDFCTDLALGDRRRTYGYVTAGGSEGLLVGLTAGHQALPGAPLYVSAAAHHAARGHAARLGMDVVEVPCREDGTMDTCLLRLLVAERPGGAVVLATADTAAGAGGDDLAEIRAAATPAGPVHVHVEAGNAGLTAPFARRPLPWDLRDGADSLSLTAHRLLGLPVPCGVVLAAAGPAVPAARGGGGPTPHPLATALLWAGLRDHGYDGLRSLVHACYDTAGYAADHLTAAGYRADRTGHGLTVRFPRPAAALCARWRLATAGPYACLTALPPLSRASVDAFCRDLRAGGPLPSVPGPRLPAEPHTARAAR